MKLRAALAILFTVSTASAELTGTVIDEETNPIENARVCYIIDKVELVCVNTDETGTWVLPGSRVDTLRAHAEGFLPASFSGLGANEPIVLRRAPSLFVKLLDEKGRSLAKGEVDVIYASGKRKGPFPVNEHGVWIRRLLEPGEVQVVGRADGYRTAKPRAVELEGGKETRVELALVPEG